MGQLDSTCTAPHRGGEAAREVGHHGVGHAAAQVRVRVAEHERHSRVFAIAVLRLCLGLALFTSRYFAVKTHRSIDDTPPGVSDSPSRAHGRRHQVTNPIPWHPEVTTQPYLCLRRRGVIQKSR